MIKNLLNLFFPKVCFACHLILGDGESMICTDCRHKLPVTNYHFTGDKTVEKVFYGRVDIKRATALFQFQKKGLVQQLLHNLKYRGYEQIGTSLGRWLGNELEESQAFQHIDMVIPVPLHKSKLRKRGFNQVAKFGKEIAQVLNAKYVDDVLIKTTSTSTQVFRKRLARWSEDASIFKVQNPEVIKGKHILLVDDIITTGATLERCCNTIKKECETEISIAAMAITT